MKRIALMTLLIPAVTGCATRGLGDATVRDHVPPQIDVTSPSRGSIAGEVASVEVIGTASDAGSGLASVTVNGMDVTVAADGSFHATVPVVAGVTLLHSVARDKSGNESSDSRSVMAGHLANPKAVVTSGLAARINRQTLSALGDIGGEELTAFDFGAAAQSSNPIANAGFTCLDVKVDLDSISKSLVVMDLTPVQGGIAFDATIFDLDAEMSSTFDAVCIPGSAGISLLANSFHIAGTLDVGLSGGQVTATLAGAQSSFSNFQLSVGIIPASVLNLIPNLGQRVADIVTSKLEAKIPQMVQTYLGAYGYAKTITVMGNDLDILVTPTVVDFTPDGGTIVMDTTFSVKGNAGGAGYPIIPAPMPVMPTSDAPGDGFKLAINDNALNQLLNAFWAAGVLDRNLDLSTDPNNNSGLAGLVDQIELYLPLPPVVSDAVGGSAATVTIGDLTVVAKKNGLTVTKVSVSAEIGLLPYVDSSGNLRLTVNTPTAYFDVIHDASVTGPNPLDDATVEALGGFVVAHATTLLDGLVGAIPVPQFQHAVISNLSAGPAPTGGYVELGGNVAAL